eukprot:TRINITY_DN551_c0_g1_i2.p2 TRINITY_DN551_c0_g1~~TRINITY_DN551_c0_g1_i2.p2  ORF type:complete len:273 (+),score=25.52 TRINITY_DN551_c0_g1_i2:4315-5133(+)
MLLRNMCARIQINIQLGINTNMAQSLPHEQLSIQEVPNILKIARQNAALGLYPDSIRSYRHALHVVAEHIKTLRDPFLKEQWKKADEEVKGEVEGIYKLYKALKVLRGEPGSAKDSGPTSNPDERPLHKASSQPTEARVPKPPPNVLERFGGQPFVRKDEQAGPIVARDCRRDDPYHAPGASNEPKKDPLVWDPPSPRYQQQPRKPAPAKRLPKWAQPKAPARHANKPAAPQFFQRKKKIERVEEERQKEAETTRSHGWPVSQLNIEVWLKK